MGAAHRSRLKKMEMVWALVAGIQELYRANWAFQQQAQNLRKYTDTIMALQNEVVQLRAENARLKGTMKPTQATGQPVGQAVLKPSAAPRAATANKPIDSFGVQELMSSLDEMLKMSIENDFSPLNFTSPENQQVHHNGPGWQ